MQAEVGRVEVVERALVLEGVLVDLERQDDLDRFAGFDCVLLRPVDLVREEVRAVQVRACAEAVVDVVEVLAP